LIFNYFYYCQNKNNKEGDFSMNIDELLADSTSKETVEEVKETVKETDSKETVAISPRTGKPIQKKYAPKKKPRGGNSPVIGDNGLNLQEGDNAKFMGVQIELFNMPNIDLNNVGEVQQRLSDYFTLYASHDMKPTVAGMALSLNGMDRKTLWAIAHDAPTGGAGYKTALPPEVAQTIKKAYFLLENLWETYMNSGKVNPVAGIFLGKNNYGYQDKTEYVLTPNQQQDSDYSADEIRERYIAADQQKRLSDSQSDDTTND
jgi:hypothetical protein